MRLVKEFEPLPASPEDIADAFCGMHSEDQARFFNRVAQIVENWPGIGFSMQLEFIVQQPGLKTEAMRVMQCIGEYGQSGMERKAKGPSANDSQT